MIEYRFGAQDLRRAAPVWRNVNSPGLHGVRASPPIWSALPLPVVLPYRRP